MTAVLGLDLKVYPFFYFGRLNILCSFPFVSSVAKNSFVTYIVFNLFLFLYFLITDLVEVIKSFMSNKNKEINCKPTKVTEYFFGKTTCCSNK